MGQDSVLMRMIAEREKARGPHRQAIVAAQTPAEVSLERAAANALGRAAERLHHLPVFVQKTEVGPMSVSELAEYLPERALLCVVEAGRDLLGVMALCPSFLGALIEMQALGRVTSRVPAARRPTRTDAAISADFVNGFLAELGRELGERADYPSFGHYRYATFLDDARPLALMLEDAGMIRVKLDFRLGSGGQRDGSILLALPMPATSRQTAPTLGRMLAAPGTQTAEPVAPQPLAQTLSAQVQDAPIQVVGVLCRRTISLRTLRELKPGATIALPQNALDEARVETRSGQLLARGRLGEADGFHAIRLRPSDPALQHGADAPPDLHTPDPFREAPLPDAPRQASS